VQIPGSGKSGHPLIKGDPTGKLWVAMLHQDVDSPYYNITMSRCDAVNRGGFWHNATSFVIEEVQHKYGSNTLRSVPFDMVIGSKIVFEHDTAFPMYIVFEDDGSADKDAKSNIYVMVSWDDDHEKWYQPQLVNDDDGSTDATHPRISVDDQTGAIAVSWYDRRMPCPKEVCSATMSHLV
jgi:hypothetical protein